MITVWLAIGSSEAADARALTLDEALEQGAAANGALALSMYARDQAESSVRSARGAFDPVYRAELAIEPTRRSRGYAGGFPAEFETQSYAIDQGIGGLLPTGTSWDASLSLTRNTASTVTRIGGAASENLFDAYAGDLSVSLGQELLRGLRSRYNLQNVTRATDALTEAELAAEKQRQDTRLAVSVAYWDWSYAVAAEQIAIDAEGVAEEALRVSQARVLGGDLAPMEGMRLEAALVQAQQDRVEAQLRAEAAANALLLLIGYDPSMGVMPATLPGEVADVPLDPVKVAEVATAQNLDLAVARQRLDAARRQWQIAKDGVLPTLTAVASAGVASQRCLDGTDDPNCVVGGAGDALLGLLAPDNFPFVSVGGVFEVPLGNRAARGARDQAAVTVSMRERDLADTERAVAGAVEEQLRTLGASRARVELADTNIRLAEATLSAEQALFDAGRSILKNVLEARTEVARTRNEAARARTEYRLAQSRLLALQGQL
ncbi:MAG: TolC family protein [Myxococcota bacterium]